ncbi:hypothetical protein BGW37DRAFT_499771 [Umbelopsis sp. PMI_123]|nr:hypothetical protein BGW37DRAFT_499771 [Umbelopsis sp. PMI_123]
MHLYDKKEIVMMARQVHGGDVGIAAARNATVLKGKRMVESRKRNQEIRRARLESRLVEANLIHMMDIPICRNYIASTKGDLDIVVSTVQAQDEATRLMESRKVELNAAMQADGVSKSRYGFDISYNEYVLHGRGSVEDVIASLRRQEEISRTTEDRRQALTAKLEAAGLTLRADSKLCAQYISSGEGNADSIVVTMKEMAWFFRCTNYESSRKFYYDSYGDSDDYDSDYDDYGGGRRPWWRDDYGWREPRRRYRIDSERGKDLALDDWVRRRLSRASYQNVESDPDDDFRPPVSIWPTINVKWLRMIKQHAVKKITPEFRAYRQNLIATASVSEISISENQVIHWLEQSANQDRTTLSSVLIGILGENWHQELIGMIPIR